ncbi:MAG: hypothetical protein ABI200_03735 [Gaiellales bacterium]
MDGTDTSITAPTLTPEDTIARLTTSAVVRWWQTTAFLEVAGPDAVVMLDGLCTQAVERVEPGAAVLGLFLDAKAKVIAPATLHRAPDAPWKNPRTEEIVEQAPRLLLETLPDLIEPLRAHLSRYRMRSKATIEPTDLASIAIVGATAETIEHDFDEARLTVTRVAGEAHPTRALIAPGELIAQLVQDLPEALGIDLATPDALESSRIDAGVAGLHDLLPGRMPAEIGGMDSAVSLDAGCYLGQEPVARLHYRGRANRSLRRVEADGPIQVTGTAPDADIGQLDAPFELRRIDDEAASRAVGRITTWAMRPDGSTVALAILRREIDAGTPLLLPDDGGTLRVIDPPAGSSKDA